MSDLRLVPISIHDAAQYVARWHRHLKPSRGALFALATERAGLIVGVIVVGRPTGRRIQDGATCEVLRCAVQDDERNACSFLYGKARRAARALGYLRGVTKTRTDESGASMRALGLKPDKETRGQSWDRPSRRRTTSNHEHQMTSKLTWTLWDDRDSAPSAEDSTPDKS